MPPILKEPDAQPDAQFVPRTAWQSLTNSYICRTVLLNQGGRVSASARRIPGLVVHGTSEGEVLQAIANAYRQALRSRQRPILKSVRDFLGEEVQGTERWVLVNHVPSIRDIDAVYDAPDLADDEIASLEAHRAAGTARPTIPVVRVPRQ